MTARFDNLMMDWVSSVDVENLIMSHPTVLEAAVIAVPHPKWVERPLACVVPKPGSALEPAEIIEFPATAAGALGAAGRGRDHRGRAQDQRRQVRQEGATRALQGLTPRQA